MFPLQSNRNKTCWRDWPFPYFEELTTIYGKDRASGEDAQSYIDITMQTDSQGEGHGPNDSVMPTQGEEEMLSSDMPCSEGVNIMSKATSTLRRR